MNKTEWGRIEGWTKYNSTYPDEVEMWQWDSDCTRLNRESDVNKIPQAQQPVVLSQQRVNAGIGLNRSNSRNPNNVITNISQPKRELGTEPHPQIA